MSTEKTSTLQWFRIAAENGDASYQCVLGLLYYFGELVPQDYQKAFHWFQLAADQGEREAEFQLGEMYYRGEGVPLDFELAQQWYRRAAIQGHTEASFSLARLHDYGEGVPEDTDEAFRWYLKAAEQGHVGSQIFMGFAHWTGLPGRIIKDEKTALNWFRMAAEQGDDNAQLNLANLYSEGILVIQDYIEAYMWANLSTAQGNPDARTLRNDLANKMTPNQLEEGQRLAREWKPKTTQK